MARKYLEAEDETRRTGISTGIIVIAPTPGPKAFQGPGDMAPPFEGGGRQADLPAGYDQRAAADEDWRYLLMRNAAKDHEAIGIPRDLDGTPWLKSNKDR